MFGARVTHRSFHFCHKSCSLNLQRRFASLLPVGIFVDLDNVAPLTHGRSDAQAFAQPLREFADRAGTLVEFRAFANINTQIFVPDEERERRADLEQEFIMWDNANRIAQTGYDSDGFLRCGICGSRMKLNKKDRARGWTMEDKLDKHMRMLHDREQEKRKNRVKMLKGKKRQKNLLDSDKFEKYEAAQVGLFRTPATRSKKPKNRRKTNDLFQVLREQGIKCSSVNDVDSAMLKAAQSWMKRLSQAEAMVDGDARGCLVVVSEDSDFGELLNMARARNILAVSVTPTNAEQTRKLAMASDLVLTRAEATVDIGVEFGTLVGKAITYKGVELLMAMDGNHKADFNSWETMSMTFEGSPINNILQEEDIDEGEFAEIHDDYKFDDSDEDEG